MEVLTHLHDTGAALDYMGVMELTTALQKPWDRIEAPTTLFVHQDKIEGQLVLAGVPAQANVWLAFALATFQASGDYDALICTWKAKPISDQTFANF